MLENVRAGLLAQHDQQHGRLAHAGQVFNFGFDVDYHEIEASRSLLVLAFVNPRAQHLRRNLRLMFDLFAQVFREDFRRLGDYRSDLQTLERLRLQLRLHRIPLGQF